MESLTGEWSVGLQHPTYGYPMTATLRIDEGDGAVFVDGMTYDEDLVAMDRIAELNALCERWTCRSFDTVGEMLRAFKDELGVTRSEIL